MKLSLLALKLCLGLRRLDSERCAPNASASLVHERVFSLINLGLQHTSFARPTMEDEDCEAMVRSLSSMAEIRHAGGVGPPSKRGQVAQSKVAGVATAPTDLDGEKLEEEEEEEGSLEVAKITAERFVRGMKEYHVEWADVDEDSTWEPAQNLASSAAKKVEEWRRSRLSAEELEAEHTAEEAAAATKEDQKGAAVSREAAKQVKARRLREQFTAAIHKVIALVKERLTMLELKGKRVECPKPAPPEVEAELHSALLSFDCQYDPKYRLMSELKKMTTIQAYLSDTEHTFDSTYMLSYQDCEEKDCKFGCRGWDGIPSKVKSILRCKPVLPMNNPKNPGHMYSYDEAMALPGGTSECDFPSKQGLGGAAVKERQNRDRGKELHPSKVRAVVSCSDCGRPRCVFTKVMPTELQRRKFDTYLETVNYTCGDALFPEGLEDSDTQLAEVFYNSEALTCRNDMELHFFNYAGLRGRDEFEHVCFRCGNDPTESPLVDKVDAPLGKVALPPYPKHHHHHSSPPLLTTPHHTTPPPPLLITTPHHTTPHHSPPLSLLGRTAALHRLLREGEACPIRRSLRQGDRGARTQDNEGGCPAAEGSG